MEDQKKKEELPIVPFVIKYDYEDMYGFGSVIVFAVSMVDAIDKFVKYMESTDNSTWKDYTVNRNTFRWVSKNVFGWNIYFNKKADVCLKVRKIETKYGDIIPIQEHFENAKIK